MAITQIKGSNIEDGTVVAADIKDDSIINAKVKSDAAIAMTKLAVDPTDASNITSGTLPTARLASVLDLSGKTVQLPAASVTAHATTPTLDSPVITGTLSVLPSDNVTHTIANWSDDVSYTITPTNCTVGAVNVSGQFVVTHTSGVPSYTIKATTASLGLADSALVTKNITLTLTAPTLSSPADVGTATDVVYTITSTDSNDDKLILDPGTANFTYQSESGPGTASKVGNTVECVGFGTGNPVVTIRFTAEATYSVTAKAVKIDGTYGTSANSSADSIVIQNWTGTVATGGAVSAGVTVGDYKVHTFIASGQFVITTLGTTPVVDFLVVAGGGGGGTGNGGGGGGGGLRNSYNNELSGGTGSSQTAITMAATGTYQITVGAGGPSTTNGIPSTAALSSTITTVGGGDGGDYNSGNGDLGGSGGGSSGNGSPGAGTPNEGYAGGGPSVGSDNRSNGGGGAGAVGLANQGNTSPGGAGGAGRQSNIDNNNWYWAGGGGGSSWGDSGSHGGAGGLGGGGGGSAYQDVAGAGGGSAKNSGANGTLGSGSTGGAAGENTGAGGGGGAYSGGTGGAGGKGIVILRYQFQ